MAETQNDFADLIKSQSIAFRVFRKTQETLVEDVAKRVERLEGAAAPVYSDLFAAMANALQLAVAHAKESNNVR